MIGSLKKILGLGSKVDLAMEIENGATVLDVRTRAEYAGGHVKGSVNIPLDQLTSNLHKLRSKDKAIITCCASGMRSGAAKAQLRSLGYTNVHNGGSWYKVDRLKNRK